MENYICEFLDAEASNTWNCENNWEIFLIFLLPGVIIGAFLSQMVKCFRRWLRNRKHKPNEKESANPCDEDRVYQDSELIHISISHPQPTVNSDADDEAHDENDDASAYTELCHTNDVANNYQSLVWK